MPSLDPTVARILDRHPSTTGNGDSDNDEDALLEALENDSTALDAFREQRMQQLSSELSRARAMRNQSHGIYSEIKEEKALMEITTETKLCVVHFFKPDFNRCRIMDGHLEELAPKHFDTRFLRINVDNAPFLVTKLKIQVLPCVLSFIDGVGVDRIVGFEGLGYNTDDFTTRELEARLLKDGVLVRQKTTDDKTPVGRRVGGFSGNRAGSDDDDDDWD
ncbi:MAG: hypothetical protein M1819_004309 [Sarea resinae]|nr:MAG: hypothetical protein M1819_004309 [Sarea resinae]